VEAINVMTEEELAAAAHDEAQVAQERAARVAARQREQRMSTRESLATARENVRRLEAASKACGLLISALEKASVYVSKISDIAEPGENYGDIQHACAAVLQMHFEGAGKRRDMLQRRLDAARGKVKQVDAQLESLSRS
jgi:hypothetical protein